ncbi:NAD(P)/FAD-dependent oxidoreductase [Roseivirga misakiensis]|uniref:FAD-dependent oxidoreductase n=1 Tax=Roseivirga misakiensis TaxID=1563681 RepID=A0A1E5T6Q5_9BACT|nr:NAD(P)/FAD-dependent oxidoreductase [Roseivirga misakiensis]OEK07061.1 FAD-dependent oxidoreductase [Roseivirga misakiensis]
MQQITIIGGGLAGLISSILLARKGYDVSLFEKRAYPYHKVCGEYISNEVKPFLEANSLFPDRFNPSQLKTFQFTSVKGKSFELPLDLGGFGISRYNLDLFLYQQALESGVSVYTKSSVNEVAFEGDAFHLKTSQKSFESRVVIGAYGKSGVLDKKLSRGFTHKNAPFIGVKYHIKTDFPTDRIALHNFKSGYCGISAIEEDKFNLCYLGSREMLRKYGSVEAMEEGLVKQNPYLKHIYENSEFLFEKPEVINAFSFAPKKTVEQHILMSGDTAGLITPLCGNGMAMAIHSAKILSDAIEKHFKGDNLNRALLEKEYTQKWQSTFSKRLRVGRNTQKLFGSTITSEVAVWLMKNSKAFAYQIMKNTHGQPF